MKIIQTLTLAIFLLTLVSSCTSTSGQMKDLSNQEARMEMMNQIADDSTMADEMMGAMMNSQNGKMMMQRHQTMMMGDHNVMMKMMKDNPAMMQSMMASMMETAKDDTSMISGICKTIMQNKGMMDMMKKLNGNNMGGMDHE